MISTIDRSEILRRADAVRHSKVFDPNNDDYTHGFVSQPVGTWKYQKGIEPIVEIDGFCDATEDAWLTVNHYNAVVLNSRNMLIADIDFGDGRLNPYAGAQDVSEVIEAFRDLDLLDNGNCDFDDKFSRQSYRIYETHSGCRVICTSRCFPQPVLAFAAKRFMRFLKSDPQYIALCEAQGCFRARLTPKPWRDNGVSHVCRLVEVLSSRVHPVLKRQVDLHDMMTLSLSTDEFSSLA